LSCVINEAKRMYSVEGAIGVACRRIVRLQKMKLRSLVGMLLHKGGQLARISFSRSRVLSESQEFVQKRGRRSREEHRRMYHSDVMQFLRRNSRPMPRGLRSESDADGSPPA